MKTTIRYLGFRSSKGGGRLFDFSVASAEDEESVTSFEIPALLLAGPGRIRLQEGVGICYSKLKELLASAPLTQVPRGLRLTASDVDRFRDAPSGGARRKPGRAGTKPVWNAVRAPKTS